MIKKSKKDKQKIVNRFMKKIEEFQKLTSEELTKIADTKMSSTDRVACNQVIQEQMKHRFLEDRLNEKSKEEETHEIVDIKEKTVINISEIFNDDPKIDIKID